MTTTTFDQLSLSPELLTAVTEMGFTETTSIQAEAIPVIRTGADVLARSQTGTGKTVAFGIPAVECVDAETEGVQVLVLSPTRELAHQCGEEIRKLAKHLRYVRSAAAPITGISSAICAPLISSSERRAGSWIICGGVHWTCPG